MTKHLALLALATALSGCFLTYDPETVEPAPAGGGSCAGPGSLCEPQSCTGSTLSYASFCSSGTCPTQSTASCDPYVCGGTGCKTSCGGDVDCTAGNFCLVSSCVAKRAAGQLCTSASQCGSGFCSPDGRCCDGACTGSCEACNGLNTVGGAPAGTCAAIQFGGRPAAGHTDCAGDAVGACAGACDGVQAVTCSYPTVECRGLSCTAGTQTNAASCSAGSCPAVVTVPCVPYVCGPAACLTACSTAADCAANRYCDGSSQCVAKQGDGATCTADDQCGNGHCADGVCCATACGGCKACNVPTHVGTCWDVPGGYDPHGACTAASCQTTCNGSGGCGTAPPGICNSSGCANGPLDAFDRPTSASATLVASCSGSAQSCPGLSGPAQTCNLHTCDGGSCNVTCLDNSDCISGTVCLDGRCEYCATNADCYPGAPQCDVGPYGAVCDCPGDPSCADSQCNTPMDCMNAGFGSVCVQYQDVCQCSTLAGDVCNGRAARCGGAPGFCTCGSGVGTLCDVGQLCSDKSTTGSCKIAPGYPCTADPAKCASGACGAGGMCTKLETGRPCAHDNECLNGLCSGTWTCN